MSHDSRYQLVSAIAVGTIGTMIFLVLPGLLGSIVDGTHITIQEASVVIAADLVGLSLVCALVSLFIQRLNCRSLAFAGLCIIVAGNLLCMGFDTFLPILAIRVFIGCGEGMLAAVMYAMLGHTSNPDRNFALYLVSEMVVGALYLWFIPDLALQFGVEIAFIGLAFISAAGFVFLRGIPDERITDTQATKGERVRPKGDTAWVSVGLFSNFIFFAALSATWGYIDRIGVSGGLDIATIGKALSFSLLGSLCGAALAAMLGVRMGRALPISVGVLISAISLWTLSNGFSVKSFFLVAFFYNFGWSGCHPYLVGLMAAFDKTSLVVATAAIQVLGMGMGPLLVSFSVTPDSFYSAYVTSFVLLLLAYPGFLFLCKHVARLETVASRVL